LIEATSCCVIRGDLKNWDRPVKSNGLMTCLPIVEREMRVASRRLTTYWQRSLVVLVTLVILGTAHSFQAAGQTAPAQVGKQLFTGLALLAFGYALLAGLYFTSDCLSEERREGTLGLLFLTPLKGGDVTLGKMAIHSFHAFYGLLAIFPVLAIPMLLGGVTGTELWRVVLILVNTLFFSLSAGLLVSSVCRLQIKAVGLTATLIIAVTCGAGLLVLLWLNRTTKEWDRHDPWASSP
jgi:ABC-type transport system involved in multi-copper enzyme maturation permease subunit